ncbi:galactose-3-O-sulfotransferase 2-like [Clavelina lepadiformis]|uniref:galactose-3-O-sulfotransferase 2-like n=1 Tax=Clavelina lepadiformis TaxID=159417 RepID=UPI0040418452
MIAFTRQAGFLVLCTFVVGTWIGFFWREAFVSKEKQLIQSTQFMKKKSFPLQSVSELRKGDKLNLSKCSMPKRNIFFMKTHKTAGSTVQNILVRYADQHDLFVGLSENADFRFHYSQGLFFRTSFVRKTEKEINMLCHHMRFFKQQVMSIMPKDTMYFTILREPSAHFESFFSYLHWHNAAFSLVPQSMEGLNVWLDDPEKYYHGKKDGNNWWFAKNGMAFDLGFNNNNNDELYIKKAIDDMTSTYHLVLITDYFEESVILLKDALCWNLMDMVYLPLNARSDKTSNLTDSLRTKIKNWNKLDSAIYDTFNKTFWKKVHAYGREKMYSEIKELKKLNQQLLAECVDGDSVENTFISNPDNKPYNPEGVKMMGYNLKQEAKDEKFCQDLVKTTKAWFKFLLQKQYAYSL